MRSPLRTEREEQVLRIEGQSVVVAYDPDGESWHVGTSSVPGLRAEAETLDELIEALPLLIRRAELP